MGVRYLYPKDLPGKLNIGMSSCKKVVKADGFPQKVCVPGLPKKAWLESEVDEFLLSYAKSNGGNNEAA